MTLRNNNIPRITDSYALRDRGRAGIVQYSATGPTKSSERSEPHNDFEPPMAYSALMCVNVITTRKSHCARLHGSIGMGRPASRAIWIVFSA
jgi:hypothetical protein